MNREQRLEEAEKEITASHKERERWIDYTIDLQRIIEALCDRRGLPEPLSTARHHYNMAKEFLTRTALSAPKAEAVEPVATVAEIRAAGSKWHGTYPTDALDRLPVGTPLYAHPTPSPIVDDAMVNGWIVGNSRGNKWWYWNKYGYPGWTTDKSKAIRYARRQDAEAAHRDHDAAWVIVPVRGEGNTVPTLNDAIVEAAKLLLSEIDAPGDINSIVGASNPLRVALNAALSGAREGGE